MTAVVLREAAALMRERAEVARAGRWETAPSDLVPDARLVVARWTSPVRVATCSGSLPEGNAVNAEHIASWHPVVALVVAEWLDESATVWALASHFEHVHALAVARAYLGTEATS